MVHCNTMAWTDKNKVYKVLVTLANHIAGTTVVTEEKVEQCLLQTSTSAEKHCMES
jgi:hypothetical protein